MGGCDGGKRERSGASDGGEWSGGREDADGVEGSGGSGEPWLLNVHYHAVFATARCIVRDEYTERESGVTGGQRVMYGGEQ